MFKTNAALPNAMDQQEEKKTKSYQSHDGVSGFSKSDEKLKCLRLPTSLKGRTVLDLGCNEGFFSLEAKRRGAKKVIGMDRNENVLASARARATELGLEIEFVCGDVAEFPIGSYDYILLLSALHYIENPTALFRRVYRALERGGTLILECGVSNAAGPTLQRALRSIDDRMFPTFDLLRDVWLKDFSVRQVSRSVDQVGDPIPRGVFHCQRRRTNVMLVLGKGGVGKTNLASQVRGQAILNTDFIFSPVPNKDRHFYPEAQRRFDNEKRRLNGSIRRAWDSLHDDPEVRRFMVDTLTRAIRLCGDCPLIVVEGYLLQNLEADLRQALGSEYRCWIARREEENSRVAGSTGAQDVPGVHTVPAGPRQLDSTREAK